MRARRGRAATAPHPATGGAEISTAGGAGLPLHAFEHLRSRACAPSRAAYTRADGTGHDGTIAGNGLAQNDEAPQTLPPGGLVDGDAGQ